MKFKASQRLSLVVNVNRTSCNHLHQRRPYFSSFLRKLQITPARASFNGGRSGSNSEGNSFLVPGATVATIVMLGVLHARRLYSDRKLEEAREKGIEIEFQPDFKAAFLRLLPLRAISRFWGFLTDVDLPVWLRPHAYRAWARAFHSNLEEAARPLGEYASLREFFVRSLKEGSRPIDYDPCCLISPVDGTILRVGELKEAGAMIEQVKGFSYSVSSLLGARSLLPFITEVDEQQKRGGQEKTPRDENKKSWWRVALASPKVRQPSQACPLKGLFYCVIYLKPGDYHRIHSPVDWNVLVRRHFSGHLFPMNERATRTIRNLYVENERVVLEGRWKEGFMAMAAIGATNVGSIELFIEPELRTNRPGKKLLHSEPPEERVYEPEGNGVMLKKGNEVAAFNMGSTVVLVFQAPVSNSNTSSEFNFCIEQGDRIRVGEAIGRWRHD
ncbi:phosphatidylserine decarboxylase proenzyme 1, mitochondrial isoform X2 [Diospyros lotus]|uniref:phosphatidylserine decarboxylase proenzyme 1, mitochondrial isoform X2 n=1 Tax=Diospyros lotus TaxID=55363 RepID=UPI00224D3766|nr:phosphatidylserine decarboxylase proenzyme 1, mitochondrial isoform X2 [Diospyros lotus]